MKKIGIVTHYYKSINYGGNLQAYALCKMLSKMGYSAEQIQLENIANAPFAKRFLQNFRESPIKATKKVFSIVCGKTLGRLKKDEKSTAMEKAIQQRHNAFNHFNSELIPHSDKVYTNDNIKEALSVYDIFITGSDQVWHPSAYNPAYRLDFVPSGTPKLSYAASLSVDRLSEEERIVFKNSLKDYIGVSVREKSGADILEELSPVKINVSLDPIFLLEEADWEELASERLIEENYVFCYFLDKNTPIKRLAKSFAEKNGLKLVTIPFLSGEYDKDDLELFDGLLYDASPEKFLSLILFADYVFTDSFHASAFSAVFKKQFFAFERSSSKQMSVRIENLINIFNLQNRFIREENVSLESLVKIEEADYSKPNDLDTVKKDSVDYLSKTLLKAEEMIAEK